MSSMSMRSLELHNSTEYITMCSRQWVYNRCYLGTLGTAKMNWYTYCVGEEVPEQAE